jgi:hypothetical protein
VHGLFSQSNDEISQLTRSILGPQFKLDPKVPLMGLSGVFIPSRGERGGRANAALPHKDKV